MSHRNPPPEGRVWLSDIPAPKVNAILPKHKAFIIYWMWFADRTRAVIQNEDKKLLINTHVSIIARHFSWDLHKINVTQGSISEYYKEAKDNAKSNELPWDRRAVAMIIKRQVSDEKTFDEVSSFLDKYDTSKLSEPAVEVVKMVQDTMKKESKGLKDYWLEYFRAGSGHQPNLDPKLVQIYDLDPIPITFDRLVQAKADRDLSKDENED